MHALKVSPTLSLPLEITTLTQVILAKKGSGKTYTAAVLTEELLKAKQQVVVLDPTGAWFGLKSSADGKNAGFPIAVIGGEHADVPLEETAGEIIAAAIVEQGFSCVIDLSLMRKGAMHRFMAPFLETLYRLNRNAMHLVVDEADTMAPQRPFGDEARTLGAMQDVVRRGRRKGIGITMITQRPQVLNKDVLTQADVLIALRVNHPKDIGAIEEWVGMHADPKQAKIMIDSLPSLPIGEAWFWAPGVGDIFERAKVRQRETFDSSATPKPGERAVAPTVLAQIDIAKLGESIAATAAQKKANDPAELRRRIAELEARKPDFDRTEIDAKFTRMEEAILSHGNRSDAYWDVIQDMVLHAKDIQARVDSLMHCASTAEEFKSEPLPVHHEPILQPHRTIPSDVKVAEPRRFELPSPAMLTSLNAPKQAILNAIATFWRFSVGPTDAMVAGMCGTTARSRGFEENMRQLRNGEYVAKHEGVWRLDHAGAKVARPNTYLNGMEGVRAILSGPQFEMLSILRRKPLSLEHLAEAMQTTVRSRGFEENIRTLRNYELVQGSKERLSVAGWLQ